MVGTVVAREGRGVLVFQVGVLMVVEREAFGEVRGQPSLRVKPRYSRGARLLPGAGCLWSATYSSSTALELRNQRRLGRPVMPRATDSAQPPLLRVASIRLTRFSLTSMTGARSDTLASGIRPVILSSRRCSGLRVARGAIAVSASSSMDGNACLLKYELGEWGGLRDGLRWGRRSLDLGGLCAIVTKLCTGWVEEISWSI